MIEKDSTHELVELLQHFPAVMLTGPRQIGKTTLAKSIATTQANPIKYLDLENEDDFKILESNAQAYLTSLEDHCVIIDEAQVLPKLFTWLRPIIDANRRPGRFILLGSADPALVKGISETLAGRVIYQQIGQIKLTEALGNGISQEIHWFKGGFPEALLSKSDSVWNYWTQSFISSYIYRDLNLFFGINLTPKTIEKVWAMLAHLNSQLENTEAIGKSLGITGTTVKRYLDFLEGAYLIHRLPSWYVNASKRLVRSPKLYLRTPGILHYLLNIPNFISLQTHPALGASWEAYVVEQIYLHKTAQTSLYFYRTHNGAEVDLVFVQGIHPVATVEIKYTNAPILTKGYYESLNDLKTKKNYVVTPSAECWQMKENVTVCSLAYFLKNVLRGV